MIHAMIDIETLDTTQTAAVLAVGIAVFDDQKIQTVAELHKQSMIFYPDIQLQLTDMKRTTSLQTFGWHLEDPNRAKMLAQYFKGENACSVEGLFKSLDAALHHKMPVWANSPTFDLVILRHLAAQAGCSLPVKFYNERDFRTLKALAKHYGIELPKPNDKAHQADYDAAYQAHCAQRILHSLKAIDAA